jgi:hypothetical protein
MRFLADADGRTKSASKLFGEAVNLGSTFTTKLECILFDNDASATGNGPLSRSGSRVQSAPPSSTSSLLGGGGGDSSGLNDSNHSASLSPVSPPSMMYGVLDHDFLIWSGDLNYALDEVIDGDDAIRIITSLKPFTEVPSSPEAAAEVTDHWHEQFAKADQLSRERSLGKIFRGFQEGPLHFRPTYRVLNGEHVSQDSSIDININLFVEIIFPKKI